MSLSYLYYILPQMAYHVFLTQPQMTECNAVVRQNLEFKTLIIFLGSGSMYIQKKHIVRAINLINCYSI